MNENKPDLIVIHHTGDSWVGRQYDKVNQYHKGKWAFKSRLGSYMGYHFLIEKSGETIQGRELDEEGAHTLRHNLRSIGIAFAGNFDKEFPTEIQMDAFTSLLDRIFKDKRWSIKDVSFHREHSDTSCPGRNMTETLLLKTLIRNATNFFTKITLWLRLIQSKG